MYEVYSGKILYCISTSHYSTLSQQLSEALHKNRAAHSWSRCNGICLVSGPDIHLLYCTVASPSAVSGSVFYAENQIIFGIVYYCTVYTEQYTYCTGIYVYSTVCRIQVAIENKYCTMYMYYEALELLCMILQIHW